MSTAPCVIEQRITAGNQWDETLPTGVHVDADGIRKFPAGPTGGRFDFDFAAQDGSFDTYDIEQIFVDFGDGAGEVAIVNSDVVPVRVVLATAPVGGTFLRVDVIHLAWDEKITLKTAGATQAMYARVLAVPGRARPVS